MDATMQSKVILLTDRSFASFTKKYPKFCEIDLDDIYQEMCLDIIEMINNGATNDYTIVRSAITKTERHLMKTASMYVLENSINDFDENDLDMRISEDDMFQPAYTSYLHDMLLETLSTLNPRQEKCLILRFGFEDPDDKYHLTQDGPLSLDDTAKEFNLTRERIRQIEARALRLLRHPCRSRRLKDYLNDF